MNMTYDNQELKTFYAIAKFALAQEQIPEPLTLLGLLEHSELGGQATAEQLDALASALEGERVPMCCEVQRQLDWRSFGEEPIAVFENMGDAVAAERDLNASRDSMTTFFRVVEINFVNFDGDYDQ